MQHRKSVRWTWKIAAVTAAALLGGIGIYSTARAARPVVSGPLRAHAPVQSPGETSGEGTGVDPAQPGSIQCCLNTADEQGCSDLLPADCAAAGGVNLGPGTCGEPDPCQPQPDGSFTENVESSANGIRGALMLRVNKLSPSATYGVNLGGTRVGTIKTNGLGSGIAMFRTQVRGNRHGGRTQSLTVDPRGKLVTLTDTGENEMLEGEISDPTTPGGIQCCLNTHGPSGDQQGCDSLLPAECVAAGGTDMGAGTCEPDPCPNTGPNDGSSDGANDGPDTQG